MLGPDLLQASAALEEGRYADGLGLILGHLRASGGEEEAITTLLLRVLSLDEFSLSDTIPPLLQRAPTPTLLGNVTAAMLQCVRIAADNNIPIGDQPPNAHLVDFNITIQDGSPHLQVYARQSEQDEGLTAAQTQALMEEYQSILSSDDQNSLSNLAARLSQLGEYEKSNACLERWLAVSGAPDAGALNMLGTNHFYLGDHAQAVAYYLLARDAGAPAPIVEYNVWEACGELIKQRPGEREKWTALYKEHFPNAERPL